MGKNILTSLSVIIPLFLFISLPFFISLAKVEWQESYFPMIWALVTAGLLAASVLGTIIYGAVTNMDLTKTKLWIYMFGN